MIRIALLLDFTEEYHKNLLRGIIRYSRQHGPWAFLRIPLLYRETLGIDGMIKRAKEWGAKGFIGQFHSNADVNKFSKAGITVIAQDFEERLKGVPNISGTYKETGETGAAYFIRKGFTNFAFYGFKNVVWSRERGEGFEQKVKEAGFTVYYFEHKRSRSKDLWYYKPSALSRWLKSLPKPVALMASDDNQALHISESCKHAGLRIPEDVAVLGVDNDENICFLSDPPLSSIALDVEQGGFDAAALMHKLLLKQKKGTSNILIRPTNLITRASTEIYATADTHIVAALRFIHQHIDQPLTVEDVLKEVPLSRRSLEKRFLDTTGFPVYKYIFNLRMEKFAYQLANTKKSIVEIANDLGMEDSKNISRQFKALKGMTPREYRERK